MLTKAQALEYASKGFCVCHGFLTDSEVGSFLQELEHITQGATLARHDASRLEMEPNQSPDGNKVRRVYEPCTYYKHFRDFAESKKLVDSVVKLLGPDVLYTSSKINVKPSEIGSVVEWHQDMAYGPLTNSSTVAVLIYLDDANTENGCLQAVTGYHRMLDHSQDGYFQGRITETIDTSQAISIEGKRGTAIFFDGLVPHASAINKSQRTRRTLILGYRAADAFPIHLGPMSAKSDQFARLVHGKLSNIARFDMNTVVVPRYPADAKSLYELQEQSRKHNSSDSLEIEADKPSRKRQLKAKLG
jgi:phytanoyl-CoA hydroxylase